MIVKTQDQKNNALSADAFPGSYLKWDELSEMLNLPLSCVHSISTKSIGISVSVLIQQPPLALKREHLLAKFVEFSNEQILCSFKKKIPSVGSFFNFPEDAPKFYRWHFKGI